MICRRVLLALAGLLLVAGPARAEELDFASPPEKDWLRTTWYSVHRGDVAVGWMRRSFEAGTYGEGDEKAPAYVREEEIQLRIHGRGGWQRNFNRMTFRAAGDQLLVALRIEQSNPDMQYVRSAVRNDSRLDIVSTFNGRKTRGALVAPRLTLADELSTERLVRDAVKRKEGAAGATLEALRIVDLQAVTARRRAFRIEAELRGEDEALRGYSVVASLGKDKWTEPFEVDAGGRLSAGEVGSGLEVKLSTKARAQDLARLGSLESGTRIPMQAELGDVRTIKRLLLQCRQPLGRVFANGGSQRLRVSNGVLLIEVTRDAEGLEVTEEARKAALVQTDLIDCEHASIVATVDRVLVSTRGPAQRVQRLCEFTSQHIENAIEHRRLKASELLANPKGDCTEHTRLFVALCRAAAIPARQVRGVVWLGDEKAGFGWHAWAEVELNGRWREVDATSNAMPADAARVRIRDGGPGALALGKTRFHLSKVERFDEK